MNKSLYILLTILISFTIFYKADSEKLCRYRNQIEPFQKTVYQYWTGAYCYDFTNENWLVNTGRNRVNLTGGLYNKTRIPVVKLDNTSVIFDYTNQDAVEKISKLFKFEKYVEKWIECSRDAMECCENRMTDSNIYPSEEYPCPAIWDAWSCFPKTKANTTVKENCPNHVSTSDFPVCQLKSEKYCLSKGWNHSTYYGNCASAKILRERYYFHLYVLYVATALMVPSILFYIIFDKLKVLRLLLHGNLLLSIIIKNILVITSKNVVLLDQLLSPSISKNVMENDSDWCRTLAFFENWSKNWIFTNMLIDAFFLHKFIVRPFNSKNLNFGIILVMSLVISALPTIIWAILMGVSGSTKCWMVNDSWYQWITDGFKYATLALNVLLLLDIMRVLFFKWGKSKNRKQKTAAIRAIVLLLPIFGLPLIVSSQRQLFDTGDCHSGDIYYMITALIEGAQGVLVALFFCYLSTELIQEFSKLFRMLGIKFRKNKVNQQRWTTTTNVGVPVAKERF